MCHCSGNMLRNQISDWIFCREKTTTGKKVMNYLGLSGKESNQLSDIPRGVKIAFRVSTVGILYFSTIGLGLFLVDAGKNHGRNKHSSGLTDFTLQATGFLLMELPSLILDCPCNNYWRYGSHYYYRPLCHSRFHCW